MAVPTDIEVTYSAGSDIGPLSKSVMLLLGGSAPTGHPPWKLIPNGKGIERTFKFKTFRQTWDFMNAIAKECITKRHHPEWSNVYNTTFIRWTTHQPSGLSVKDADMAAFCDDQATRFGEVIPEVGDGVGDGKAGEGVADGDGDGDGDGVQDVGRELADRVAKEGGDCCVPKGKGKM